MALAEISPRLAGLLVHRALRPMIDMSKRLSVYRESHAEGPLTRMMTYVTLCCLGRTLPEVLGTPELPPHAAGSLPACKRALLTDHSYCQLR